MKWQRVCWLLLYTLTFDNTQQSSCKTTTSQTTSTTTPPCGIPPECRERKKNCKQNVQEVTCFMKYVDDRLETNDKHDNKKNLEELENVLEETNVTETTHISMKNMVAVLVKPKATFTTMDIYANEEVAMSNQDVPNSKVRIHLPKELDVGPNNTIVFCMISWNETNGTRWNQTDVLYENRLIGVSVGGKNVSGLQERVNITMNLTTAINTTQEPRCVFLNFTTQNFSSDGCITLWKRDQNYITCSCDHLTYFGVLMLNAPNISSEDTVILTYITLISCSLSLLFLVITLLLFFTNRKLRSDVSMRVHISLSFALILLNLHFIISQQTSALLPTEPCYYMALALHYSLLTTFSWMALEGFHLYILLVRVFNIYIRRYLLKLSVVGWGFPAVIVSLVVIIDPASYGHDSLITSTSNGTMCYITKYTVKTVTTVGVFSVVFIFNMIMLVVTIRRVLPLRHDKEFAKNNYGRAKRNIFTLLGISTLLGITWGLVFFSFGSLTTVGLYTFCILNSLQGFFIFLWFVLSLRKTEQSSTRTSSETRSTS